MTNKNLHPSIQEFKQFVQKHPGLVRDVKRNGESWQDYYEKWVLLGEDDPSWEKYKKDIPNSKRSEKSETSNNSKVDKQELINQMMKMVENVDLNKVQNHINQLNGAITNIQSLVGQFQDVKKQFPSKNGNRPPFNINKD